LENTFVLTKAARNRMNRPWQLPRRTFLKGLGTAVALPVLEAMLPPVRLLASQKGSEANVFPRRMAFVYLPNGMNMADWTPKEFGEHFELPLILDPLKEHRQVLQIMTRL